VSLRRVRADAGGWDTRTVRLVFLVVVVGLVGFAGPSVPAPTFAAARAQAVALDPAGELFGVSCATSTYCLAVGTTAASWDGHRWHLLHGPPEPAGTVQMFMNAVSCPAANDCVVVGDFQSSRGDTTLAEHWNGTSWLPLAVGSATHARLDAVACPTTAWCMAAGTANAQSTRTLAGIWNGPAGGGWRVTATPNRAAGNVVRRLSCASATACVGLGPAVDQWNGTRWQEVSGDGYGIVDVSCLPGVALTGCTYLGLYGVGRTAYSDTMAYGGTSWHSVGDIHGAKLAGNASYYACGSAASCVAVGQQTAHATGDVVTYAERSDDGRWAPAPAASPNPPHQGLEYDAFFGVSCAGSDDCAAVGRANQQILAEHWNGIRWTADGFVSS